MGITNYDQYLDAIRSEGIKKEIRASRNIDFLNSPNLQNYYQNFDRYYSIYNNLELDHLTQYVFIVRPDLNLVQHVTGNEYTISDACKSDVYLRHMVASNSTVTRSLTDTLSSTHDFIPWLVGRTESIQMPDISIKNYSISQPFTNIMVPYAGNMWESLTGGSFDITFREDAELRVHKLFQMWVYYMDGVTRNVFYPKNKYIEYNKYDYMCSVYYFVCKADGESILWWNKYTGAFPTSVPNSDLSFNLRGSVDTKITIPFVYFMQDIPTNPYILIDFNRNAGGSEYRNRSAQGKTEYSTEYLDGYDPNVIGTRNGMFGCPFITDVKFSKTQKGDITMAASNPKLRWRAPKVF